MQGKGRFQLVTISLVTLLVFAAALSIMLRPATTVQAKATKAAMSSRVSVAGLHVVGNQIVNGSNIVLSTRWGSDRMGGEYSCLSAGAANFDGPVDQASITAMKTWDINIVRLPMNEDCWLGINGEPANGSTAAQYQQAFVNYVNLLNANNIVVVLDLHWTNAGTNKATGQQLMPDLDHAPAFWTSVANTFKTNSSVVFDLFNEPFPGFNNATTTGWACWKNGSTTPNTAPCADAGFAVAGMQTLVNTVRATGATNMLMLGGLAFSNDLSQWLQNEPTDPMNNLVASTHIYNFNVCSNTACWDSQIAPVAAKVPVLAGEIGENDCASGFITNLMTWLDQHHIGYLAWTWSPYNCSSTPALISDYTGTPTNFGLGYKAHLLALGGTPPPPPPTPTPMPTPGMTPTPMPTPGKTPTPVPGGVCGVHYAVQNQWATGFTTNITLSDTGSSAINGWTLKFAFPGTQTVTQGWSGTFAQTGNQVTITNLSYNGAIAPGGSVSFGFNGALTGSNPSPTSFTVNGTTCSTL